MEKTNSNYPRTRDTYTGRNIVYDESFSRTNKIILDSHSTTMMSEKTGEVGEENGEEKYRRIKRPAWKRGRRIVASGRKTSSSHSLELLEFSSYENRG